MFQDFTKTVSDIVRDDYRTADVFKRYGINYCCNGNASLLETCTIKNIDYNSVSKELDQATKNITISNTLAYTQWKTDFLIDYIINVHHAYLYVTMPALETALIGFIDGHKKKHPELKKVLSVFQEITSLLTAHKKHEEEIIFPYIKQIDSTHRRRETYGHLFVRTLRKPLSHIEKEHDTINSLLEELKNITNNYTFPSNACTSHQVIFRKLKEFHDDMIQHEHLENDILFPRAIEMEKELLQL